jgi:hypothetical protein
VYDATAWWVAGLVLARFTDRGQRAAIPLLRQRRISRSLKTSSRVADARTSVEELPSNVTRAGGPSVSETSSAFRGDSTKWYHSGTTSAEPFSLGL